MLYQKLTIGFALNHVGVTLKAVAKSARDTTGMAHEV